MKNLLEHAYQIAGCYFDENFVKVIHPLDKGNINNTFIVYVKDGISTQKYILQNINQNIFHKPEDLMNNLDHVLTHIHNKLIKYRKTNKDRYWNFPRLKKNNIDNSILTKRNHLYWRVITYIENSLSLTNLENDHDGFELGYALSTFHSLMSDFQPSLLKTIIPDLFTTENYLIRLSDLLFSLPKEFSAHHPEFNQITELGEFFLSRKHIILNFNAISFSLNLTRNLIHSDPKISNILLDKATRKAISVIDLDTVCMGYLVFDIADCLRSICNRHGEDNTDISLVEFNLVVFKSMLMGYKSVRSSNLLSIYDCNYLVESIKLITLQLGIRFFSDYLDGNIYFSVNRPNQNLERAKVQFRLVESIENQSEALNEIIYEIFNES